jgi:hypothetical protein
MVGDHGRPFRRVTWPILSRLSGHLILDTGHWTLDTLHFLTGSWTVGTSLFSWTPKVFEGPQVSIIPLKTKNVLHSRLARPLSRELTTESPQKPGCPHFDLVWRIAVSREAVPRTRCGARQRQGRGGAGAKRRQRGGKAGRGGASRHWPPSSLM